MKNTIVAAALLALLILAQAVSDADAATLLRGSAGASGVVRKSESGVAVWRGAKPAPDDLAGAAPPRARSGQTVIVVACRRGPERFVRTQGFYSGRPGASRRFAQGFWSGPVDLGRRVSVVRIARD